MKKAFVAVAAAALSISAPGWAADGDRVGDFNLQARGGVSGFTGALGEYTAAGPSWGVGLNVQPYRMIGFEVNYEGSRNHITDDRFTVSPSLTRHGASAMVKLAPPFLDRIRPFAGVGLGASYVSADDPDGLYRSDFIQEVPLAAGLEFNSGMFSAGLRATYRFLIDENFADAAQPVGNPEGGLFDASVMVGARF
ncbi:MAG: outer membrane beta-barrel protein [Myxococcota bacterium]|nr:outer membrane beta-barrel protein [Myxococcota bacterium]